MQETLYTVEDIERLGGKYELYEGRLIPEEPRVRGAAMLATRIGSSLAGFTDENRCGVALVNAGYILRRDPDTFLGPDISVVTIEHFRQTPKHAYLDGAPQLAVEILSPRDRPEYILQKVGTYLRAGCRMVWVADQVGGCVVIYRSNDDIRIEKEKLNGEDVLPGFECDVHKLFKDVR